MDERLDPLKSTDGAARLLQRYHSKLNSWPLTITAYNHGLSGVRRAIEETERIVAPIERAILWIGFHELKNHIEVPYRVVINEGVNLARRFGAVDGHKYVNACLDKGAQALREIHATNPEALMFGTDLPSTRAERPYSDSDFGLVIEALGADAAREVFHGNAARFYRSGVGFTGQQQDRVGGD